MGNDRVDWDKICEQCPNKDLCTRADGEYEEKWCDEALEMYLYEEEGCD